MLGGIPAKANGRIQARTLRLAGWRGKQVGRLVGRGKQSRQAGLAGRCRLDRLMQTKVGVGVLGDDDDAIWMKKTVAASVYVLVHVQGGQTLKKHTPIHMACIQLSHKLSAHLHWCTYVPYIHNIHLSCTVLALGPRFRPIFIHSCTVPY